MMILAPMRAGSQQQTAAIITGAIRTAPRRRDFKTGSFKYTLSIQYGFDKSTRQGQFIDCDVWPPLCDLAKEIRVGDMVMATGVYSKRSYNGKEYETVNIDYIGVAGASAYVAAPANAFFSDAMGEAATAAVVGGSATDRPMVQPPAPTITMGAPDAAAGFQTVDDEELPF